MYFVFISYVYLYTVLHSILNKSIHRLSIVLPIGNAYIQLLYCTDGSDTINSITGNRRIVYQTGVYSDYFIAYKIDLYFG